MNQLFTASTQLIYTAIFVKYHNNVQLNCYLLSNVRKNPWAWHNVSPSFHPCWIAAVKFTGTPNSAMISSANIIFINSVVNSSCSCNDLVNNLFHNYIRYIGIYIIIRGLFTFKGLPLYFWRTQRQWPNC